MWYRDKSSATAENGDRLATIEMARKQWLGSIGRTAVTVAQTAINDARLAPTSKPKVEIWRRPHKRTRSARLPI